MLSTKVPTTESGVQGLLSLRWREWMTQDMLKDYMAERTYYNMHSNGVVDNPDQRLTADINNFTSTFLGLAFTFLTSIVDLVSFSGILFGIYPPLFVALLIYAIGGTTASFYIGKVCCNVLSTALSGSPGLCWPSVLSLPAAFRYEGLWILMPERPIGSTALLHRQGVQL